MVLTLYSLSISPVCRGVLLTIAALGLQNVEIKKVDITKGEQFNPEFLKLNPQHTIPVLEDDDFKIWDSHAIMTYLVSKYAKDDSFYPKDYEKRALVDQRLHFEGSIVFACIKTTMKPIHNGEKTISEESVKDANEVYDFLDKFLENYKFAAGDSPTIADFSLVGSVTSLDAYIPIDKEKYANLNRWLNNVYDLPYYQENVPGLAGFKAHIESLLK